MELCVCEFSPRYADEGEDSWHFLRVCKACGFQWGSLHCPHDGYQNPCPECGVVPTAVPGGSLL